MEGIIDAINSKNPTGSPSEEDIRRAALAVCNGDATIGNMYTHLREESANCGPGFLFLDRLFYLRTTHAWGLLMLFKRKCSCSSSPEEKAYSYPHSFESREEQGPSITSPSRAVSGMKDKTIGTKRSIAIWKQVSALNLGGRME